jgi:hypothetical protein
MKFKLQSPKYKMRNLKNEVKSGHENGIQPRET